MSVKERMYKAANMPQMCDSCRGHISIGPDDFKEVEALTADRDEQFDMLKDLAKQGAASKCGGCSIADSGSYDKETLSGQISCRGSDSSHVPPG